MAMPAQDEPVRPRAAWYGVPTVLWLVALVLFVLALVAIANVVNAGVDRTRNHAMIPITSDGLTFYTTGPTSGAECALVSQTGGTTPVDTLGVTLHISVDGRSYNAVGVTPDSLPAGTYELSCADAGAATRFGTGPRVDVTALATRALWGIVLPMLLGLAGLAVFIVLIVRRHGAKSRIRSRQAYASTAYGPGRDEPHHPGPSPQPPPPPPGG